MRCILGYVAFAVFFQNGYSLRCHECSSKDPDRSCFSPLDTEKNPSKECRMDTLYSNVPEADLKMQLKQSTTNTTDFQCVVYEKIHLQDNKTQTTRLCAAKSLDYCQLLNSISQVEKTHNITRCDACETENCNSGVSLGVSFVSMVTVALLILQ